jgi:hypothetical protein
MFSPPSRSSHFENSSTPRSIATTQARSQDVTVTF